MSTLSILDKPEGDLLTVISKLCTGNYKVMSGKGKMHSITVDGKQITCRIQTWREREFYTATSKQVLRRDG